MFLWMKNQIIRIMVCVCLYCGKITVLCNHTRVYNHSGRLYQVHIKPDSDYKFTSNILVKVAGMLLMRRGRRFDQ